MFSKAKKLFLFAALLLPAVLAAQTIITVQDGDINANDDVVWTANNTYLLDGLVYVEDGAVLTIEAGTVVKGKEVPSTGDNTSALIITRGAKIIADGTATAPIIFTAESDDLSDPNDVTFADRGLWGGILLLGKASINTTTGEGQIEGIDSTEPRGGYGGGATPDDADNSGILRYVSLRHGGSEIGAGNEINGLTLGAVGSGTTIEHVEVLSNLDDGFEWFGGTVRCKYLVAAFVGDDAFDYDEGFRGYGQFWFAIMDAAVGGGRVAEQDGGTDPEDGQPFAKPMLANVTYIGAGVNNLPQGDGSQLMIFRDNAGGNYYGSIFTDYNGANDGLGITVEDLGSGEDSRARLEAGDLVLSNNIWFGFAAGNDLASFAPQDFVQQHLTANNNHVVDPELNSISRSNDGLLDPRPRSTGPAASGATQPAGDFFDNVDYYGAFDPSAPLWTNGWTALSQEGHTSGQTIILTDASINAGETLTLTSENDYLLDGLVFVEAGATLNIDAGTVIKGKEVPSNGDNTSALIVTRDAQIFAQGTATAPIIFTAEADDINDPNDLTIADRGLWGGLLILGRAGINTTTGEGQIEGIDSTEPRGGYGGGATPDDADNSGILRYVSLRHGGSEIGAGNEINGLTLGAVGSGTTIEYVEILSNLDDGVEWFGGTVNCKYLSVAFVGDDAFDYDEGFRGKGQFWFAVMDAAVGGGRVAEQDGGTDPEDGQPFAKPMLANVTYIGAGVNNLPQGDGSQLMIFRDNAGGNYYGSIFTDYNGANDGLGITVEDLGSGEDSRARLEAGDLVLSNNIWFGFAAGNDLASFAPQDFVQQHLTANNNQVVDPELNSISRSNDGLLDPRPSATGPAASGATQPNDPFFVQVSYYGAFDPSAPLWTDGWTALDQGNITSVEERKESLARVPVNFTLSQNYPNPFNPGTNISYTVAQTSRVKLTVYNLIGQKVATLVDGIRAAGAYTITWNASDLSSGVYLYRLDTGGQVLTRKMTLLK